MAHRRITVECARIRETLPSQPEEESRDASARRELGPGRRESRPGAARLRLAGAVAEEPLAKLLRRRRERAFSRRLRSAEGPLDGHWAWLGRERQFGLRADQPLDGQVQQRRCTQVPAALV